jgi:hypothetical protein
MQIADGGGTPRGAFIRDTFASIDRGVLKSLSERFVVRLFRFSSVPTALRSAEELSFAGAQTRLGTALEGVRQELAGLPLAGLVLVSDGADTDESSLTGSLLALKADSIPVFTVGVGTDHLSPDIEIARVATPRSVLKGTSMLLDVVVQHSGYNAQTITLDVEDDGHIVGSEQVRLPANEGSTVARVRAIASESGPRVFRFRVAPRPGEIVTQNNVRQALIDVEDRREKILYFEGEPRFELKFIRRAADDDKNLQVVALQRTADKKYEVSSPRSRRCRTARQWLPENPRGALCISGADSWKHRSGSVHR